jgi:K+-sensing histidine kinase KdpD
MPPVSWREGRGSVRALLRVQPWSAGALALGLSAVFFAAAVQALLFHFGIELYFATFLPAVFFAGFLAGVPAAALVVVVTVPLVWWAFIPPYFEFNALIADHVDAITMFLLLSLLMIFLADWCRAAIALLNARTASEEG